ncbi:MAG: GNAT family N-acetyltransferase [Phycisphaeraceae bacterium]
MDAPYAAAREQLDDHLDPRVRVTRSGADRHLLELIVDSQVASRLTLIDFQQQIETVRLRMGGIAAVNTDPAHRFRGHARSLLWHTLGWMRQQGFDLSLLFGIADFYPKFGYAPAFSTTSLRLAVRDAEQLPAGDLTLAPFNAGRHLDAVLRIFRRHSHGRTGPIVRDRRTWTPFRKGLNWHTRAVVQVALDARGRVQGYWARDDTPHDVTVLEVGCAAPAVAPAIIRAAGRHGVAERVERIRFVLPPDHPVMRYATLLGGTQETHHRRDAHAMARLIHVGSTLRKLAPLLATRLPGRGSLNLKTNLDHVTLRWGDGEFDVSDHPLPGPRVQLPQWALAQLILGHADVSSLAALTWIRGSNRALDDLARLFPMKPHHFPVVDEF